MSTKIGKLSVYFEDSFLHAHKISDDQYFTIKKKIQKEGVIKRVDEKPCGLQVKYMKENKKYEIKPNNIIMKSFICDQYVASIDFQFCTEFLDKFPMQNRSDNCVKDMKNLFLDLQKNLYNELKLRAI